MIKQLTHENCHSGLSVVGDDSKWYDMLNFRSFNGRTRVVPRKYCLWNKDAGFHTIIQGLGNFHYVIGSRASYVETSTELPVQLPLWNLTVQCANTLDSSNDRSSSSQHLQVRGCYTGQEPKKIRVIYVKEVEPAEPEPSTPTLPIACYDCEGASAIELTGTVRDSDTDEIIPNAEVQLWTYGVLAHKTFSNGLGVWGLSILAGEYVLKIIKENYQAYTQYLTISATDDRTDYLILTSEATNIVDLLDAAYINVYTDGDPFHRCDAAVFKVYANNVFLGWANLNNLADGDPKSQEFVISTEQATQIAAGTDYSGIININVFPDNTHPSFDDPSPYTSAPHFDTLTVKLVYDAPFNNGILIRGHGGAPVENERIDGLSYQCDIDLAAVYVLHNEDPIHVDIFGSWMDEYEHTISVYAIYRGVQSLIGTYTFDNSDYTEGEIFSTITKTRESEVLDPGHFDEICHPSIVHVSMNDSNDTVVFDGPINTLVTFPINP